MNREKFIEGQIRETNYLLPLCLGEYSARRIFQQLAIDSFDFLVSEGVESVICFAPSPDSAGNPLRYQHWAARGSGQKIVLSAALIQRWESWDREYIEIRARNPRLGLIDMMQAISESHKASSWPDGYEALIRDWVDAGDAAAPPPFDDRRGIVTLEFFDRLRELRRACVEWVYWSDEQKAIVFMSDADWQQTLERQRAAALELLDRYRSDTPMVLREIERQQGPE